MWLDMLMNLVNLPSLHLTITLIAINLRPYKQRRRNGSDASMKGSVEPKIL